MGITAKTVARAAAGEFGITDPNIEELTDVHWVEEIHEYLHKQRRIHTRVYGDDRILVFYTLVEGKLKRDFEQYLTKHPEIIAVDLLGAPVKAIERLSGEEPGYGAGMTHITDEHYYERIAALEFTIYHDDGRITQDLTDADIVIIGVSRTSKTPTSIYLGQQGYRVANIPLVQGIEPPKELYKVDKTRLYGLITSEKVLVGIRQTRLKKLQGKNSHYASPEYVRKELAAAKALMRELGCAVINTENRAIEETAQEILRFYEKSHPRLMPPRE